MAHVKPLRLFFALWPDDRVREELAAVVKWLKRSVSAKWVNTEKLHMTLAFLGDVEADRLDTLKSGAGSLDGSAFELNLDRVELWRRPGIICLGASSPPDALNSLAADLATNLRSAGFELETRPFRAHLTVARKAKILPPDLKFSDPVRWSVASFCLVESRIDRQGSHYAILRDWPLPASSRTMPDGIPVG
jgi:2'-5' RNA ligase